jgi:hypothetical protein
MIAAVSPSQNTGSENSRVPQIVQTLTDGIWFVRAYTVLLQVHWLLKRGGWKRVRATLERQRPARTRRPPSKRRIAQVERAVLSACDWQIRPTACLPRSIVAYRLLLKAGVQAQLNIGFRVPILGHAWVEVDGQAIADDMTPLERQEFQVTTRLPIVNGDAQHPTLAIHS